MLCDGAPEFDDDDCEVRLEGAALTVSYFDDEGPVVFVGSASAERGHFELVCRSRPRRGTLRRSDDGHLLRGSWQEGDLRGRWEISLGPQPMA